MLLPCFMTMCVSALALTSLDAVARIGRMSFQELFSVDDMEHAEGWRKLFCNVYFSTFITLAVRLHPDQDRLRQHLAAVRFCQPAAERSGAGHPVRIPEGDRPQQQDAVPPLIIMLCVTFTALVQRLIAMVKAISAAASVSIPAGETTWGAVFIANGLQLILAVLLIVLGLNIVFHSLERLQEGGAEQRSSRLISQIGASLNGIEAKRR